MRVAAFVSGGVIAPSARGKQATGLATLADVWGTLCALALADPVDHTAAASGLLPVDGMDLSEMITGRNLTASRRQQVPLAPLKPNEVLALEAWESACRLFEEQQQLLRVAPTWDVHHASCGQSNANKIDFIHTGVDTIAGCEAACGANAACVQFEWKAVVPSGGKHWCALYNLTHPPHKPSASSDYECGCKGACPASPGPSPAPPGPPGPSPPTPKQTCTKQQGVGFADANLSVVPNHRMNDCCGICSATKGCAGSYWVADPRPPHTPAGNGSCILKASILRPVNMAQGAAFFPPGVKPPAPVLTSQAGLIVGDWKIITGTSVNMAIWTGEHYPNKSTPYHESTKTAPKVPVPSFACSAPGKRGCLFNVAQDLSEHNDLALSMPEKVDEMIAQLQAVSKSFFNPQRGGGDKRACAQATKNGVSFMQGKHERHFGFFGPWLELPAGDGGSPA